MDGTDPNLDQLLDPGFDGLKGINAAEAENQARGDAASIRTGEPHWEQQIQTPQAHYRSTSVCRNYDSGDFPVPQVGISIVDALEVTGC